MGFQKILSIFIALMTLIVCLAYMMNVVLVSNMKTNTIDMQKAIVTYAQVNGGFCDSNQTFTEFYNDLESKFNMKNNINSISFSHPIGEKLQRGTKFTVSITPKYTIILPFVENQTRIGKEIIRSGYSRNFRKELENP